MASGLARPLRVAAGASAPASLPVDDTQEGVARASGARRRGLISLKSVGYPARTAIRATSAATPSPVGPASPKARPVHPVVAGDALRPQSSGHTGGDGRPSTASKASRAASVASLPPATGARNSVSSSMAQLNLGRPASRPSSQPSSRPSSRPASAPASRAGSSSTTPASSAPSSPRALRAVVLPSTRAKGVTSHGPTAPEGKRAAGLQRLAVARGPTDKGRVGGERQAKSQNARARPEGANGPFDVFPDELVLQVLQWLDCNALLCVSGVSRRMSRLSRDAQLWRRQCVDRWGKGAAWIAKMQESAHSANWHRAYLQRIARQRVHWASTQLSKLSPYTGLPKVSSMLAALHVRWELRLRCGDGRVISLSNDDSTDHTLSTCVRWRTGIPADLRLKDVVCLELFALVPLLADPSATKPAAANSRSSAKQQAGKTPAAAVYVPMHRSLLCALDGTQRDGIKSLCTHLASEQSAEVFTIAGAPVVVGCWTSGGGIAFLTANLPHYGLIEGILRGSERSAYAPPPHVPVSDDVDPSYGLHDYSLVAEVRSERKGWWSNRFDAIHYRGEDGSSRVNIRTLVGGAGAADGPTASRAPPRKKTSPSSSTAPEDLSAAFVVLEEGGTSYAFQGRPATTCKSEAFEHVLESVVVVDFVLMDEHKHVVWADSRMLRLQPVDGGDGACVLFAHLRAFSSPKFPVSYAYSGGTQHVAVAQDARRGALRLKLVHFERDKRTVVAGASFSLRMAFLRDWFGLLK